MTQFDIFSMNAMVNTSRAANIVGVWWVHEFDSFRDLFLKIYFLEMLI